VGACRLEIDLPDLDDLGACKRILRIGVGPSNDEASLALGLCPADVDCSNDV
jgi:hypothetical protein